MLPIKPVSIKFQLAINRVCSSSLLIVCQSYRMNMTLRDGNFLDGISRLNKHVLIFNFQHHFLFLKKGTKFNTISINFYEKNVKLLRTGTLIEMMWISSYLSHRSNCVRNWGAECSTFRLPKANMTCNKYVRVELKVASWYLRLWCNNTNKKCRPDLDSTSLTRSNCPSVQSSEDRPVNSWKTL